MQDLGQEEPAKARKRFSDGGIGANATSSEKRRGDGTSEHSRVSDREMGEREDGEGETRKTWLRRMQR